jgi:hypothetical protein
MEQCTNWRELAFQMLVILRSLFVVTITWDFFLTIGFQTAQRALVFTGIGSLFAPYLIVLWLFVIVGMAFTLIYGTYGKKECEEKIAKLAYFMLFLSFILYGSLLVLSVLITVVAWPVVLNYLINLTWVACLIYFRREFSMLDKG